MRYLLKAIVAMLAVAALTANAADDYPKLRAGQWEMSTAAGKGHAPRTTVMCTNDAVQKELISMGMGMQKEMCSKNEMKREGSRVTSTSQCKIGDSTIVTKAVMTFSGDTSYKTEIDSSYAPPFMGMKESKTTMDGKFVGPCRDGLVPGDMLLPGGQKINIKNLGNARAAAALKAK